MLPVRILRVPQSGSASGICTESQLGWASACVLLRDVKSAVHVA